jgi:hypothetical protein
MEMQEVKLIRPSFPQRQHLLKISPGVHLKHQTVLTTPEISARSGAEQEERNTEEEDRPKGSDRIQQLFSAPPPSVATHMNFVPPLCPSLPILPFISAPIDLKTHTRFVCCSFPHSEINAPHGNILSSLQIKNIHKSL